MHAVGQMVEKGVESAVEHVLQWVPERRRPTWALRSFGLTKVPLLLYCLPEVVKLDAQSCCVRIPLGWRTRNHYRSMYFGALAVGADACAGMLAMHHAERADGKVQLLFKDFHADFVRRADSDVHFVCSDGDKVGRMVAEASKTGERVNDVVHVEAQLPGRDHEVVAHFALTLSLKSSRSAGKAVL